MPKGASMNMSSMVVVEANPQSQKAQVPTDDSRSSNSNSPIGVSLSRDDNGNRPEASVEPSVRSVRSQYHWHRDKPHSPDQGQEVKQRGDPPRKPRKKADGKAEQSGPKPPKVTGRRGDSSSSRAPGAQAGKQRPKKPSKQSNINQEVVADLTDRLRAYEDNDREKLDLEEAEAELEELRAREAKLLAADEYWRNFKGRNRGRSWHVEQEFDSFVEYALDRKTTQWENLTRAEKISKMQRRMRKVSDRQLDNYLSFCGVPYFWDMIWIIFVMWSCAIICTVAHYLFFVPLVPCHYRWYEQVGHQGQVAVSTGGAGIATQSCYDDFLVEELDKNLKMIILTFCCSLPVALWFSFRRIYYRYFVKRTRMIVIRNEYTLEEFIPPSDRPRHLEGRQEAMCLSDPKYEATLARFSGQELTRILVPDPSGWLPARLRSIDLYVEPKDDVVASYEMITQILTPKNVHYTHPPHELYNGLLQTLGRTHCVKIDREYAVDDIFHKTTMVAYVVARHNQRELLKQGAPRYPREE